MSREEHDSRTTRAQLAMDGGRTWLLVVGLTVVMIAVYVGLEVADVVL